MPHVVKVDQYVLLLLDFFCFHHVYDAEGSPNARGRGRSSRGRAKARGICTIRCFCMLVLFEISCSRFHSGIVFHFL